MEKKIKECPSPAKASEGRQKKDIGEIKKELEECQKKSEEYLAGWQRSRADFLNYKKEEIERITEVLKYANEGLILEILPALDSFEKAEKQVPKNETSEGFLQIKAQLQDFLKKQGVEEIKSVGESFDPNFHEAIEGTEGVISEEIQKGYKLNGKVIRPARVKIKQ